MLQQCKLFADGSAYDSNDIFRCFADNGILPCIKVRKNAKVRWKKGTSLEIYQFWPKEMIYKSGRIALRYGQRWIVETVFSCIKRTFDRDMFTLLD